MHVGAPAHFAGYVRAHLRNTFEKGALDEDFTCGGL